MCSIYLLTFVCVNICMHVYDTVFYTVITSVTSYLRLNDTCARLFDDYRVCLFFLLYFLHLRVWHLFDDYCVCVFLLYFLHSRVWHFFLIFIPSLYHLFACKYLMLYFLKMFIVCNRVTPFFMTLIAYYLYQTYDTYCIQLSLNCLDDTYCLELTFVL